MGYIGGFICSDEDVQRQRRCAVVNFKKVNR